MIKFQKITKDNFEDVIALDAGDNDEFVERNVYSIAESKIIPEYIVEAIYEDAILVGFAMYKIDDIRMYINRFMIDENSQGQGLGSQAMRLLLDTARSKDLRTVKLHVHPENTKAISFYRKFGFVDTGKMSGGENEFELVLN